MAGLFRLSNYDKPGKGIEKDDPQKRGISLYFDIFFRRLRKICALNVFYVLFSIPAFIIAWFVCAGLLTFLASATGVVFPEDIPYLRVLTLFSAILMVIICGSGPASVATNYVLRKYANDTHSWAWSDFVEQTCKNFKQGLQIYIVNTVITTLIIFAYMFYSLMPGNPFKGVMSFVLLFLFAVFVIMQLYTYHLACAFELKTRHIYRNAFLLAFLGIKWNILAVLSDGVIIYFTFKLSLTIPLAGIVIGILLLFSVISYTQIFITNNTVKKYVLEPFLNQTSEKSQSDNFDSEFEDI